MHLKVKTKKSFFAALSMIFCLFCCFMLYYMCDVLCYLFFIMFYNFLFPNFNKHAVYTAILFDYDNMFPLCKPDNCNLNIQI